MRTRTVISAITAWLALATLIGVTGLPQRLTPPAPQLVLLLLTVASILVARNYPPLHAWMMTVDSRGLIGLHLTRAVAGVAFLVAASHGTLPRSFALGAAYGDIAVAIAALAVILLVSPEASAAPKIYALWNSLGLIDVLLVVGNAARIGLIDRESMTGLLRLPFVVLPLWLVPLLIASHIWLFQRILRSRRPQPAGA